LAFKDILGLKLPFNSAVPKQRRSDTSDTVNYKKTIIPQKRIFHKPSLLIPNWDSKFINKIAPYQTKNLFNFVPQQISFPMNESHHLKEFVHFRDPELVSTSSPLLITTVRPKYSIRMDDTINTKNFLQPTMFYAVSDNNVRNKWFETYAKIKQIYTGKKHEKSQTHIPNSNITNTSQPVIPNIPDKTVLVKL